MINNNAVFGIPPGGGDTLYTIRVRKTDTTLITNYYPGGWTGLYNTLRGIVRYPAMEKDNGIQGLVVVSFRVSSNGSVAGISIDKGVPAGRGLEQEAIRAIKRIPWIQALRNGMPPDSKVTLSVGFYLSD
ncbi:MAG TPA: energy transducer TonB [Bacteroidia bacterium]|nr:energy transducer TonB [Bacteroidia bacterium]